VLAEERGAMIHIADYGLGNPASIVNMLRKAGHEAMVTASADDLKAASKLILPGVGAFDHAMRNLKERDLIDVLTEKALGERVPTLGICLGMQIMTRSSEEGDLPGLGWISAATRRFFFPDAERQDLRIPHMGWNQIGRFDAGHPLLAGLPAAARFYFVHSYHVTCDEPADVLATAHHGYEFAAIVAHHNIVAVQFHPEKSHTFGLTLLKNFAEQC
jgi:imidazole glycerol-phosphate synthase subunit HisH